VSSASFLARLLLGLEKAFSDFADELGAAGAPVGLLDELGWTVPPGTTPASVGQKFANLSTALQGLSNAAQTLSQLPPDAELEEVLPPLGEMTGEVGLAVNAVRELTQVQPAGLPAPFSNQALWTSLADEAVDLIVVRYLDRNQHLVGGLLRVLGVIVEEPQQSAGGRGEYVKKSIEWDALGTAFSRPQDIMPNVYGWGGTLKGDLLLRNLACLLGGFGLSPARYKPMAALRDIYYAPTNPARTQLEQLSVPLYWEPDPNDPSSNEPGLDLGLGALPIPPAANPAGAAEGLVLFPELNAATSVTFELGESVDLTVAGGLQAALVRIEIRPSGVDFDIDPPAVEFSGSALIEGKPDEPWILLGTEDSTRVELDGAHFMIGVDGSTTDLEATLEAALKGARVVIEFGEGDGFLTKVLGEDPQQAEFSLAALWSSKKGFRFEGQAELDITLALHLSIAGVFSIDKLYITLGADTSGKARMVVAVAASLALGPVAASIDRVGLALDLVGTPPPQPPGNLGSADLSFGFKPPEGVGMVIDASVVTGGGYIEFREDEYVGILEVSVANYVQLKVIGLLNTKLPDGRQGFSLLLIITAEFQPINLGYGFTLNGVGGLAGINRTMVTEVIRSGIRNGTVRSIMFPPDPVKNAPQLISNLRAIFPVVDGRYVFGPMVMLGWGAGLIKVAVGVLLEIPEPIRLVILGRIMIAVPPTEDEAVVKVNLDVVGIIEFEKKQISVDATIYDSTIAGLALSGDMAMRLDFGEHPNFALSMGGLHPEYPPPPNFPKLERLTLQFGSGDNPRIAADAYKAITANSFQIGAQIGLHAEAGGFAVDGGLGFDALFIFSPSFSMTAEMTAGVQLLRGREVLMCVRLWFKFSGPHPWHAQGSATARILFFDVSVPFDKQWGDPSQVIVEALDARKPVLDALGDIRNWSASLPADEELAVTFGDLPAAQDAILVHPMGRLTVRQKVAPLDYTMGLFGNAPPSGANRFTIGQASLGQGQLDPVSDQFAVGQFTKLSDDEKLTRPCYEPFRSGASLGSEKTTAGHVSSLDVHFETTLINERKQPEVAPLYALAAEKLVLASQSAAGVSQVLNSGSNKFVEAGVTSAISTESVKHVIASTDDLSVASALVDASGVSAAAAQEVLASHLAEHPEDAETLQVVPAHEAATA
jgi:hypothetical protein